MLAVTLEPQWGGSGLQMAELALVVEELARADGSPGAHRRQPQRPVPRPTSAWPAARRKRPATCRVLARGEALGRLGPLRAGQRLRRSRHAHPGGARRRLAGACSMAPRSSPPKAMSATSSSSSRSPIPPLGKQGHHRLHRRPRCARLQPPARCATSMACAARTPPSSPSTTSMLGRRGQQPRHARVGGLSIPSKYLDRGRITIGALAVGLGLGCAWPPPDVTLWTASSLAKPIAEFQAIQWKLADMATEARGRAAAGRPRRLAVRHPASPSRRRHRWPSCSPPKPRCGLPTLPCTSTAATATRAEFPVEARRPRRPPVHRGRGHQRGAAADHRPPPAGRARPESALSLFRSEGCSPRAPRPRRQTGRRAAACAR